MDNNQEYHDPDYPGATVRIKKEPPSLSEEEKVDKIRQIIRREFSNELEVRENEVMLIDQRMTTSRRLLHRLRYVLVSTYYRDQKLQLTNGQIQDEIAAQRDPRPRAEVSTLLREGQRQLHPSVRKLLGKEAVDLEDIFRSRGPRNKTRKDYTMLQKRNYTISADTTKTLRPDKKPEIDASEAAEPFAVKQEAAPTEEAPPPDPRRPRRFEPRISNVLTLDEVTRNKMKHRYRIIIGNTSKYAPAASSLDRSTHKWLLYVRGPPAAPHLAPLVSAVTVTLHPSYAPHHTVTLHKPPFHITRRGWGEFPARVQLHFALPERNRPATVEHTIKLDRNYTGLQVLGAETLVDVWLYSTPEMLEFEFTENNETEAPHIEPPPKDPEPAPIETAEIKTETGDTHTDNWLDFFSKPTELDVDGMIIKPVKQEKHDIETMIDSNIIEKTEQNQTCEQTESAPDDTTNAPLKKRIMKYMDPATGKIYYLEIDRQLDINTVQEIVIDNTTHSKSSLVKMNGLKNARKRKAVSLLKPEVQSLLKNENSRVKNSFSHIENDHCYLASPKFVLQRLPALCIENVLDHVDEKAEVKTSLYQSLCNAVPKFNNLRTAVGYLVKKIPLVSSDVKDPEFVKHFPFVVESYEKYWRLDFAKRRNIEWSRAKLINRILTEHFAHVETIWRTKQILLYCRLRGHYPVRPEAAPVQTEDHDWSSWNDIENRKLESNVKAVFPNASDINSLSLFEFDTDSSVTHVKEMSDDEEVDVVNVAAETAAKKEPVAESGSLTVLPVDSEDDRMRFMFIERKCADIGIELRNEDVGNGYSYSAVHAVLLSAVRSFAEDLVRDALAAKRTMDADNEPTVWPSGWGGSALGAAHVWAGARRGVLSARALARRPVAPQSL